MKNLLFVILVLSVVGMCYAQDESIELTTYYPAPYGDYDWLTADSLQVGNVGSTAGDSGSIELTPRSNPPTGNSGTIYFDDGSDASRTAGLYMNNQSNWTRVADDNTYLYSAFQTAKTFFNQSSAAELGLSTGSIPPGVYICYISFLAKPQTTTNSYDASKTDPEHYVGWFRWWSGYAVSPAFAYSGNWIGKGPYHEGNDPWQDIRPKNTEDVTAAFAPFSCFRIFEVPASSTGVAKIWFWNSTAANRWGVTVKDLRIYLNKLA